MQLIHFLLIFKILCQENKQSNMHIFWSKGYVNHKVNLTPSNSLKNSSIGDFRWQCCCQVLQSMSLPSFLSWSKNVHQSLHSVTTQAIDGQSSISFGLFLSKKCIKEKGEKSFISQEEIRIKIFLGGFWIYRKCLFTDF